MARKITAGFVRVHEDMPDHPKIEGLSDKAFRLLVETWCWCRRHPGVNGHITASVWAKRGTPAARRELDAAGLIEDDLTGGAIVHDWDDWQLTSTEIDEAKVEKAEAGARGGHARWHEKKGIQVEGCQFCYPDSVAPAIGAQ